MKTALLAFSGGLDTSFCIPYLMEKGYGVVTATVNTGGFNAAQLKKIAATAKKLGSVKHYEVDAQAPLYNDFASYIIKANYLKGGVYPACVGPERNVIAIEMAKIAKLEKTNVVVHGSTGAGNDQVRFDLALKALIPNAEILVPIRDENLTRDEEIVFLQKRGFSYTAKKSQYSVNIGLLGTTISGAETLNAAKEIPDEAYPTVRSIDKAPTKFEYVELTFDKGLPVKLNGKKMSGIEIISKLNGIAGKHGFGRDVHIGTTIIGIKGRIAFEAPALKLLVKAHSELEKLTLTSKQIFWKTTLGTVYGDMVHEGLYFDPVVRDIESFIDSASEAVKGTVKIKLHKGTAAVVTIDTPNSLMRSGLGTYGEKTGKWTGEEARGFCKLYGMESANAYLLHSKK